MKRAYQNRAIAKKTELERVQICMPMAEVLTSLEQGLGELVRKVGRIFIESVLESEVEQIAGPRSCRSQTRRAYRWGVEQGSCVIDGQRVRLRDRAYVSVAVRNCYWGSGGRHRHRCFRQQASAGSGTGSDGERACRQRLVRSPG